MTGFASTVETGDLDRFTGASIASCPGLAPSEHSSGEGMLFPTRSGRFLSSSA
ncbi:IS110 family transposase [Propionibacterium ruminifibrarum]|uniref:IS110 family transposase n=1 Tax=Propionibacterium ruminifibrarum TaxID=1962131 RepID=UPI001C72567B|nr:IS110 family transposase [Propionibacterium ruminifibrarum]